MKRGTPELALIELLTEHFGRNTALRGAEVGVSEGITSAALLRALPRLKLFMVDIWAEVPRDSDYRKSGDGHAKLSQLQQDANYSRAKANTRFAADRRYILRLDSVVGAKAIPGLLDFGFIDDDHTLEGVRRSLAAWLPKVRPGGLLAGDDIDHPRDVRGIWGVRRGVTELTERLGVEFGVRERMWWFVVPEGADA